LRHGAFGTYYIHIVKFKDLTPFPDGYPHMHVLLMGKTIADINVKKYIESLWRKKYGMGFIKMNVVKGGIEKIIFYQ
jgi:hypothetical protein